MPTTSFFHTFACLSGAASVACGAFGGHALKGKLSAYQLSSWQTATTYQLLHSLALLVSSAQPASQAVLLANYAFTTGITLFSGSIYGLCLTQEGSAFRNILGPATPIGGMSLIIAWVALALGRRSLGPPRLS